MEASLGDGGGCSCGCNHSGSDCSHRCRTILPQTPLLSYLVLTPLIEADELKLRG